MLLILAPSAPPRDVMPTTTSRSITVTWDTITCIERNGIITSYTVEFGPSGNPTMRTGITALTFTANGLTPFTNYTFQVAAWSQQCKYWEVFQYHHYYHS